MTTMYKFNKEVIEASKSLKGVKGRPLWKYKPITEKQRQFLKGHIPDKDLDEIDRGAASLLTQHLINLSREASAWTGTDW